MADDITDREMRLLDAMAERQARYVPNAQVVPHLDAARAGIDANTSELDRAVDYLVQIVRALEPVAGESGTYTITQRGVRIARARR